MVTVACVLIVHEPRVSLVQEVVLPSVLGQGFSEILWVGDGHPGDGYRFLPVPKLTGTTLDALVKRDVGTLATNAEWLFYLADDHRWACHWPDMLTHRLPFPDHDIIVPGRWCDGGEQPISLNMGMDGTDPNFPYCAGHGGFFRKTLIEARPWTTMPHHPNWDLLATRMQMQMGARVMAENQPMIQDLEPERQPWK